MKKIILGLLSLLFLSSCQARGNKKAAQPSDDNSLLWRIRKEGRQPSYLFGTIHAICPTDYLWTETMRQSLSATREVCLEMDMDDPNVTMQVAAGLLDLSGKQLKDYFTPEQYARLERFAKDSLGTGLEMFQMMKPSALISLFTLKTVGCSDAVAYESKIVEAAQSEKKEVTGLETASEQLKVLNDVPTDTVVAELMEMTEEFNEQRTLYDRMVAAYKAQELPRLYTIMKESGEMSGEWNAFLDDRNRKWIPRMEEKMKRQPVFFAVGAGHLYGDAGVIALLRKAGYTVEPVR